MLDDFWQSLATDLASRWVALAAPATIFWLGGLLAWSTHHGGFAGIIDLLATLSSQPGLIQVSIVVVALLAVAASAVAVNRMTDFVLPLLEGYWPKCTEPILNRAIAFKVSRARRMQAEWEVLATRLANASPADLRRYLKLDNQLRLTVPGNQNLMMPTRLGNILRAAEGQPYDRYGLEITVVWPRLWLVLPDSVRGDLTAARTGLNSSVAVFIWCILFCGFSVWSGLAAAFGISAALATYFVLLPSRAATFGSLFESTFDIHRSDLYRALMWPLPSSPADDRPLGVALSEYLFRGTTSLAEFAHPTTKGDS